MPHPIRGYTLAQMLRPGWSEYGSWRVQGSHAGFDYYCPAGTPIYATDIGTVIGKGGPTGPAGWQITIQYAGYTTRNVHMNAPSRLPLNSRVNSSTVVGYVGSSGNAGNIIWNGKRHLHHEVYVNKNVVNPIIFYGPIPDSEFAGGDTTPIVPEIPYEEQRDRMYTVINATTGGVYSTAAGFIKHHPDEAEAVVARNVTSATDSYISLNQADFNRWLVTCGVAPTIVAGNRFVFNPESGVHENGGTWSWGRATYAEVLKRPTTIPAPVTAQQIAVAVVAALPPLQGGVGPTVQQIALAVESQLADNFGNLPAAVNLDLKNRL